MRRFHQTEAITPPPSTSYGRFVENPVRNGDLPTRVYLCGAGGDQGWQRSGYREGLGPRGDEILRVRTMLFRSSFNCTRRVKRRSGFGVGNASLILQKACPILSAGKDGAVAAELKTGSSWLWRVSGP